jgi:hypothetical protein
VAAKLLVELVGDATSAVNAFKKTESASQSTTSAVEKTSSSFGKIAKAVATGYAVKKVIDFGKETVQAASDARVANLRLESTFKNAGDASGAAAEGAIAYAEALGRQIGVSPSVVKGAEAILATFHSLTTPTANTADLFNRATAAAADLAAAGFGDMDTNAKQLGKALEDPTKGLTALARSGVTFTQQQKDQIKAMQKSGDLLGAQKVVMEAVEGQVKGTAASTATGGAKMRVAFEELKVSIGNELLPIVGKMMKTFAGFFDFISANASWLIPLVAAVAVLAASFVAVSKAVNLVKTAVEGFKLAIAGVRMAWMLLNAAFAASPLGVIIIGVILVVAALVLLYLKVDWFRAFVNAAMAEIVAVFVAGWDFIVGIFNWVAGVFDQYGQLILFVLLGPWYLLFQLIKAAVTGGWSGVVAQFQSWLGILGGVVSRVLGIISGPFVAAWGVIYSGLISPLAGAFNGVVDAISAALSAVTDTITAPFKAAWDFIQNNIISPLKSAWNAVANAINGIHLSFTIPSNAITDALHIGGKGFDWSPPFNIPTLARGGLITSTGVVFAHAGEVISPAPARAARSGPLVQILTANFGERVDVDTFGKRLAWELGRGVA